MMRWIIALCIAVFPAQALAGKPKAWQIGFQPAASPLMEQIAHMHNLLLIVLAFISVVVVCLLGYAVYRFRESRNPIPSTTSHHTILETIWTVIPVLLLIAIGIPSLKLMFFADRIQNADMTIKAIGRQWYWSYEYPDEKIAFDSLMIETADLKPGQLRLLEVDRRIVVPIHATVRVIVTSDDVLHSFAVPSLGIKKDAVPGRLNETWFRIGKEGVYYGQCSELCGVNHGFMPIAIEAVSPEAYATWLAAQKNTV